MRGASVLQVTITRAVAVGDAQPRAGAREILPVVAKSGASRVVYISCHSGSLARDAGLLVREHGYRLTAAGVMDMFPHTTHVEAMAIFDR